MLFISRSIRSWDTLLFFAEGPLCILGIPIQHDLLPIDWMNFNSDMLNKQAYTIKEAFYNILYYIIKLMDPYVL